MNFYKHHLGDYAQATGHLNFIEDAAYSRLIRKYYADERPIPADLKAAQRLVGARTKEEKEAVETVLNEFFSLESDGWHNRRCDVELAKASAQADTNRKIAEEREARRRERLEHELSTNRSDDRATNRSTIGQPSQTPDSRLQTPDTNNLNTNQATLDPAFPSSPEKQPDSDPRPKIPDCPHADILALWAEVLPALPQHNPDMWRGTRADHLRARWRETASAKKWPDKTAGLDYLRKLFAYIGKSQFLTGQTRSADPAKRPFVIELEWLVNPTNWAKVHEGKYHPEA